MTAIIEKSSGGPYVCVDVYRQAVENTKSLHDHNLRLVKLINSISFHISNSGPLSKEKFIELVERNIQDDQA